MDYEQTMRKMIADCVHMGYKPISVLFSKEAYGSVLKSYQQKAHRALLPEPHAIKSIETPFGKLPIERVERGDPDYVDVGVRFDS